MKHLLFFACVIGFALRACGSQSDPACGKVTMLARVEVQEGDFSLADLLPPGACQSLLTLAAASPLGHAPLPGSPRVLAGEEIRALLNQTLAPMRREGIVPPHVIVPERITVQASGPRASCDDLAGYFARYWRPDANCGAAGRIRQDAPVAITKTHWSPAHGAWEITARCLRPKDCVPFLISGRSTLPPTFAGIPGGAPTKQPPTSEALVRPGQKMTLLWDQGGIQLILRVTCMDPGTLGQTVRARVQDGDRVLRATVMSAQTLRVQL
jgi:Chaperone for flagella basal body P-ring formation